MFEPLAQYLREHSEDILQKWREDVRQDPTQPAARMGLQGSALDDHLPSLLQGMAAALSGGPQAEVAKEGAEHGHQRRQYGYTVTELLSEMTRFRRALMAAIEHDFQHTSSRLSNDALADGRLSILNQIDLSVQASVTRYLDEAEAERDHARAQVADINLRLQGLVAELKEAHVQKDRFLSVLSHELRSPLAAILNAVQVLQRLPVRDEKKGPTYCAIIERQVRHLSRLVDDLLDLNRITHGKLELRPEVMSLQTTIAFVAESNLALFQAKDVKLVLDVGEDPVTVVADPTRVSQVLTNLLSNAVKFTPGGGSVTLSLRDDGSHALISVRDTGVGIAPEMLERVFDPFEQAGAAVTQSGGLGLGLMIARGLVEAQGGSIEARSAGKHAGAEFLVRLPLAGK